MKACIAVILLAILGHPAEADPSRPRVRCDNLSTEDLAIDGVLEEWTGRPVARVGTAGEGTIELRCTWDGTALGLAMRFDDDRIVRVRSGRAHEDRVELRVAAAGERAVTASVKPGNPIAKAVIAKPARSAVADSLHPKGFQIEAKVPAVILPGFSPSTPALALEIAFHDSDQATGGDTTELVYRATIELGDRKDLLDDFLRTVKLRRGDVKLDTLADVDPDRRGKERVVAGGTVIGILTDRFGYVTLPAASPADVLGVELLPLGNRGQAIVAARVRQAGNGGSRELLMLWTVWSGQLEPLVSIELAKQVGTRTLSTSWKIVKGKRGPELWVEPRPAVGFTPETWQEEVARDVDAIVLPWDPARGGVAYFLDGKALQIARRDLPKKRR